MPSHNNAWSLHREGVNLVLVPRGAWDLTHYEALQSSVGVLASESNAHHGPIIVDGSELSSLDTSGSMAIIGAVSPHGDSEINIRNFSESQKTIFNLVHSRWSTASAQKMRPSQLTVVQELGEATLKIYDHMRSLLTFFGAAISESWNVLVTPALLRRKEFVAQLELVFVDAIPIVSLVTMLIGIVLAYLFAMQLMRYGANIFVVDGVVIAMCREISPLIVAITVAGRSGSAFTAQLGTMKLNQEIDALATIGLSPVQVLVLPRVLALMVALPLLVLMGDIVGSLGGVLVSQWYVGISSFAFFERVHDYFALRHFYIGVVKAPLFALFIAVIGCKMGLTVENNARSVGLHTTSTVVQSIVSVIILDAIFAVVIAQFGW